MFESFMADAGVGRSIYLQWYCSISLWYLYKILVLPFEGLDGTKLFQALVFGGTNTNTTTSPPPHPHPKLGFLVPEQETDCEEFVGRTGS